MSSAPKSSAGGSNPPPPETANAPPSPSSSSLKDYGYLAAVLLVATLMAGTILRECPEGSVTGAVHSTGQPLGDFVIEPVGCYRGGHWGFDGVFVVSRTLVQGSRRGFRGGLKVIRSASGQWEAHVEIPRDCTGFKCPVRRIDPAACRLYDVTVDKGWLRSDGHARLECEFSKGGTLRADVSFDFCGAVPSSGD